MAEVASSELTEPDRARHVPRSVSEFLPGSADGLFEVHRGCRADMVHQNGEVLCRSVQSGNGNSGRCMVGGCHLLHCRCLPGSACLRRPVGRVHARRRDERCTRLLGTAHRSSVVRALNRDGWRHPRESRRRSAATTPGSSRDGACLGGNGLHGGRLPTNVREGRSQRGCRGGPEHSALVRRAPPQ
jgi:hypothetical protein